MKLVVDTREQKYEHVTNYFDSAGITWERQKLDVGDYFNPDNPSIVIDRRNWNVQERVESHSLSW